MEPCNDLLVYARIIQQVEMVFFVKYAAMVRLDVKFFQRIAMSPHSAVETHQKIAQQVSERVVYIPAQRGCDEKVIDAG